MLVRLEEEMAQFIPSTETATLEAFAENPVPLISISWPMNKPDVAVWLISGRTTNWYVSFVTEAL